MTRRNANIVATISMILLGLLIFHIYWNIQVYYYKHFYKSPLPPNVQKYLEEYK